MAQLSLLQGDDKQKSESALRTIGEVAKQLGVQTHVLRFWEQEFSQLRPLKSKGRRYYRPEDVAMATHIHTLLHVQGYTIKGAKNLLQSTKGDMPPATDTAAVRAAPNLPAHPEMAAVRETLQGLRDHLHTLREELRQLHPQE